MNKDNTIKIKELNLDMIQPNSKNYMNSEQGGSKIVIIGKPGCFSLGTEILMYDGNIKKVENINNDDLVMGWDSKPRKVLELCRNIDKMYTIKPDNSDDIVVNEEHILTLKCVEDFGNYKKDDIIDISVKNYLQQDQIFKNNYKWFRKEVVFNNKHIFSITPYHLGLMIGSISLDIYYKYYNISNNIVLEDYIETCFIKEEGCKLKNLNVVGDDYKEGCKLKNLNVVGDDYKEGYNKILN